MTVAAEPLVEKSECFEDTFGCFSDSAFAAD